MDSLLIGIVAGAIGIGYFMYGRRQTKIVPMAAGVLLCVVPYMLDSLLWLAVVSVMLIAAPFLIDF